MAPASLAALRLPDGRPLPPSLATFLAFDTSWIDVLEASDPPALRCGTIAEYAVNCFDVD